jgi:anti-sigma factor RsiW
MNCKRIQEFLMTDYIDGEASDAVQKEIRAHLKTCAECGAIERLLREKVSGPFRNIEAVVPPEETWHRIKEAIEQGHRQYVPGFLTRVWDAVGRNFLFRRPRFALTAGVAVVFVAVLVLQLPFRKERFVKEYLREQSEYMMSLRGPVNGELDRDVSFDTAIDIYFF